MRSLGISYRKTVIVGAILLCAALMGGSSLMADTYDFSNPLGTLGTSQTYNGSGSNSVTAYGFLCTGVCVDGSGNLLSSFSATDLYGKNAGAGETGLGIAQDPLGLNEISANDFVNLDLSNAGATTGIFTFDSLQSGESLIYCLGNDNSTFGNSNCGTIVGTGSPATLNLNWGGFSDISISGVNKDILVSSLVTTPEPGTLMLLGTGLMGMAGALRRKLFRK